MITLPLLEASPADEGTGEDFWVVRWRLSGAAVSGVADEIGLADFVVVEDAAVRERHSCVDGVLLRGCRCCLCGPRSVRGCRYGPAVFGGLTR